MWPAINGLFSVYWYIDGEDTSSWKMSVVLLTKANYGGWVVDLVLLCSVLLNLNFMFHIAILVRSQGALHPALDRAVCITTKRAKIDAIKSAYVWRHCFATSTDTLRFCVRRLFTTVHRVHRWSSQSHIMGMRPPPCPVRWERFKLASRPSKTRTYTLCCCSNTFHLLGNAHLYCR